MKTTRIHLILITLIFSSCQAQEKVQEQHLKNEFKITNKDVLNLRNKIAVFNEVQDKHIGYAGSPSEQYRNYENLLKITSDKELFELTKDTNYTVATYAAFGLIERAIPLFVDVFKRFLKVDKKVRTMSGCMVGSDLVSSEIYHEYWNKVRLESIDEKIALQNDKNLLLLDSLILVADTANWLLYDRVFSNRIFKVAYLPLIEKHAFKNENIYAIEYLFQHNHSTHEEQIIDALKNYLNTDEIWPIYYDKIFQMMLSYKKEDLNKLLILELEDIKKDYGETKMFEYRKILLDNNVKI